MNPKIQEVHVFECTDGKQFQRVEDAETWQKYLDLKLFLEDAEDLYWREICASDVATFLLKHFTLIPKEHPDD